MKHTNHEGKQTQQFFIRVHFFDVRAPCDSPLENNPWKLYRVSVHSLFFLSEPVFTLNSSVLRRSEVARCKVVFTRMHFFQN